ncbi:MAG TPA: ATP-binding cassette domain-containing protein [Thermoanaerobaculia bacterium]|nr:ATP-binding cassette domain-containing protein [Thermoanaerobaculia bacterium]
MIEAQNLSRRYGDFTAVDGISFSVGEGEIVGMLGPNGAGKTTTIRMITGFLPPTGGRVTVAGKDLVDAPREARRELGYLPENVALYTEMRVHEYLAYRARLEGLSRGEAREAIGSALDRCLLADVKNQIIGTLSKGYRQRVGLATAILHKPKVLVLDEPTVGLDPKQIIAIRELIRQLGRERTLLLSTHILPEVELLCDRVIIIDQGKIVAEGTPQALRESFMGNPGVRVMLKEAPDGAAEALSRIPGVAGVRSTDSGTLVLDCERGADPREEVFRAVVENGWVLLELARERGATLEDLFVRLTTHDTAAEPAAEPAPAAEEAP